MSDIVRKTYEEEIVRLKAEIERLRAEREEAKASHYRVCSHLEHAEAALDKAREAIQNYLDGNYDSPRSHRPNNCKHGTFYWEPCEQCIDAHFEAALAAMEPKT